MSDLAPTTGGAAATTDGDNRYKAVQHKLKTLGAAMDLASNELETLLRGMRMNAQRAEGLPSTSPTPNWTASSSR